MKKPRREPEAGRIKCRICTAPLTKTKTSRPRIYGEPNDAVLGMIELGASSCLWGAPLAFPLGAFDHSPALQRGENIGRTSVRQRSYWEPIEQARREEGEANRSKSPHGLDLRRGPDLWRH